MPKHSDMIFRLFSVHAMGYQEKPEKNVRGKIQVVCFSVAIQFHW